MHATYENSPYLRLRLFRASKGPKWARSRIFAKKFMFLSKKQPNCTDGRTNQLKKIEELDNADLTMADIFKVKVVD